MTNAGSVDAIARFRYERMALRSMFTSAVYEFLFFALSSLISILYMFLLPSLPLGAIVPYAIHFITPVEVVFSLSFGVLMSLVVTLNVYAFRTRAPSVKGTAVGSVLASLVNGLCCTPLIPGLLALMGASTPVLYEISPKIQGFFELNYPYFYGLSAVLLLISIHYLSRNIYSCCNREAR